MEWYSLNWNIKQIWYWKKAESKLLYVSNYKIHIDCMLWQMHLQTLISTSPVLRVYLTKLNLLIKIYQTEHPPPHPHKQVQLSSATVVFHKVQLEFFEMSVLWIYSITFPKQSNYTKSLEEIPMPCAYNDAASGCKPLQMPLAYDNHY
jgi:hypothetical protein